MSTNSLINKVAVITGGISGIGYACAERFAEEGASLVLADLVFDEDLNKGAEVAQQLQADYGVEVIFVATDVTQEADVEALGAAVMD